MEVIAQQIIDLVARGLNNAAIAESLNCTREEVERNLRGILHELGLTSRVELVLLWYSEKFLTSNDEEVA